MAIFFVSKTSYFFFFFRFACPLLLSPFLWILLFFNCAYFKHTYIKTVFSWLYYFCFLGHPCFHFLHLLTISHGDVSSVFCDIFSSAYLPLGFSSVGAWGMPWIIESLPWTMLPGSSAGVLMVHWSRPVCLVLSSSVQCTQAVLAPHMASLVNLIPP